MTRDEVIDLILRRCQRNAGDPRLIADLVKELNAAQRDLENDPFKPWFLLTAADLVLDANGYYAVLPDDFLSIDDNVNAVMLLDTDSDPNYLHKLEKAEYAEVARGLKPVDRPAYWCENGGRILLSRAFVGLSVRVVYKARLTLNTSAYGASGQPAANYWYQYAAGYLAAFTGGRVALFYLSDEKKAEVFNKMADAEKARLVLDDTARTEASRERFIGSEEYEEGTGLGADGAFPAPPLTLS